MIDAHLVFCAVRLGHDILTGDSDEITTLTAMFGHSAPVVHTWP